MSRTSASSPVRHLDLCVVAARHCPTSRAYLSYLKAHGLRPTSVLLVDFIGHPPSLQRLSNRWGRFIAAWSKRRMRYSGGDETPEFHRLCGIVQDGMPIKVDFVGPFDFRAYAERITRVTAHDYNDPDLWSALRRERVSAFLYTDGGRVPDELLAQNWFRILHVHPGVVPQIRGSNGLLWSLLERGRPGASCFYMNPGIDTGDVIAIREYDRPCFQALAPWIDQDAAMVHRALLQAYDPHLRAQLFVDVAALSTDGRLDALPCNAQPMDQGRDFFAMEPRLRARTLRLLLERNTG